ncbi:hypothetical protein A7U60_g4664 [Sanghuangporus baumii]|uniref:Uncharacterized protein n=1 Tax=Sanghuangporus baumii TaxID=108892 RepID=A0A9Q5HYA9_SANBA|nr:hypothetical protein A7U60_g4664 [Sanghuangporus baumii]
MLTAVRLWHCQQRSLRLSSVNGNRIKWIRAATEPNATEPSTLPVLMEETMISADPLGADAGARERRG